MLRPLFGGGGRGGKPPFPRPLRILRVSLRRWWARSCWPRETSVSARVSMSDVRSSILRWTTCGCGGMGGVEGRPLFEFFLDTDGRIVIANNDGRGRCDIVPSRRMSPYVRSAWINGTSSTLRLRWSS